MLFIGAIGIDPALECGVADRAGIPRPASRPEGNPRHPGRRSGQRVPRPDDASVRRRTWSPRGPMRSSGPRPAPLPMACKYRQMHGKTRMGGRRGINAAVVPRAARLVPDVPSGGFRLRGARVGTCNGLDRGPRRVLHRARQALAPVADDPRQPCRQGTGRRCARASAAVSPCRWHGGETLRVDVAAAGLRLLLSDEPLAVVRLRRNSASSQPDAAGQPGGSHERIHARGGEAPAPG